MIIVFSARGEILNLLYEQPKVSAIIPTYNSSCFIIETLESLLTQTLPLSEIIIVDDKSTDETCQLIQNFSNKYKKRIHLYTLSQNSGSSIARNIGLKLAQTSWVLLMDHDDIAEPNLLEQEWKRLMELEKEKPGGWVLVHSAYNQISEDGKIISSSLRWRQVEPEEVMGYELIRNRIISNSGVLLNRETALRVGGYDPLLKYSQDWDLWLRLAQVGGFGYSDEPLVRIRRHQRNTSNNIRDFHEDERKILKKYPISFMEEAINRRHLPREVNQTDFASLLYRLDLWEEGHRIICNVIHKNPELPTANFVSSLYYIKKCDWEKALLALKQTVKLAPEHGAALNNLGVIYAINNDIKKAEELFRTALKHFPGYLDATHNLSCLDSDTKSSCKGFKFTWRELRSVLLTYSY